MTVITPLEKNTLYEFFDDKAIEAIKYFMIKSIFAQPEKLPNQKSLPLQIPKEHIEQWFTQALGVSPVGAGSFPIDIYDPDQRWGADIKMLSIRKNSDGTVHGGDTGEASLGQNFKGVGQQLDGLFERKEYDVIKDLWLNLYAEKFQTVKSKYPIDKFYYFFLVRSGESFYLMGASVNLDHLDAVVTDPDKSRPKSSLWLRNMIDDRYGNTKVYKAKKRLELRLKAREWIDAGLSIEFKTNFNNIEANLRDELANDNFKEKAIEELRRLEVKVL